MYEKQDAQGDGDVQEKEGRQDDTCDRLRNVTENEYDECRDIVIQLGKPAI